MEMEIEIELEMEDAKWNNLLSIEYSVGKSGKSGGCRNTAKETAKESEGVTEPEDLTRLTGHAQTNICSLQATSPCTLYIGISLKPFFFFLLSPFTSHAPRFSSIPASANVGGEQGEQASPTLDRQLSIR